MTDKELIQKLNQIKELKAGGAPDSDWVLSNKEILMSQIQPKTLPTPAEKSKENVYYFQYFGNLFRQRVLRPAMATLAVVAMLLGYTATVTVANASLPGETLYPIKTVQEKVQLAFTFKQDEKVRLQMTFVSRRAVELKQIAQKVDTDVEKVAQVQKTAKKITEDVKEVKENLNKITISANSLEKKVIIDVAKEIDTKTLEVKQGIKDANNSLSEDIKEKVAKGLKEAIDTTENTGARALIVIVEEYEKGEKSIDDSEVSSRVAERIKDAESNIIDASRAIEGVTTTTPAMTASINEMIGSANVTTTLQNLETIKEKPQVAQGFIEEAKTLLDSKEFVSALEKITQTNEIINSVVADVKSINQETEKNIENNLQLNINVISTTSTKEVVDNSNSETGSSADPASETK